MSQRRGSSGSTADPRLDIADHYVFDAARTTALVLTLRTPRGGLSQTSAFHPEARYEFRVHLDGQEREGLVYRVAFQPAEGGRQTYVVERHTASVAGPGLPTGTVIAQGRTGEHVATLDGGQVWAGEAVQPVYLDLRQLHAVVRVVQRGEAVDLTQWGRAGAEDSFAGTTVRSIVLTVPVGKDGLSTGRPIATWAASVLPIDARRWRQVGRSGLPMIWSIFRPDEGDGAGDPRRSHPADDPVIFGPMIAARVASAVELLRTSQRPDGYADSVAERILPDLLHYIVGSPAGFGFGRFNGRRLADNAPEVMFSLTTNSALATGLLATAAGSSQESFPFVVPTAQQSVRDDGRV